VIAAIDDLLNRAVEKLAYEQVEKDSPEIKRDTPKP
jgi:hypothetical protein